MLPRPARPPGPREVLRPWTLLLLAGLLAGGVALVAARGEALWGALAFLVAVGVVKARWVYVDASRARLPAVPWASLALLLPVFGVTAYLVFREMATTRRRRP